MLGVDGKELLQGGAPGGHAGLCDLSRKGPGDPGTAPPGGGSPRLALRGPPRSGLPHLPGRARPGGIAPSPLALRGLPDGRPLAGPGPLRGPLRLPATATASGLLLLGRTAPGGRGPLRLRRAPLHRHLRPARQGARPSRAGPSPLGPDHAPLVPGGALGSGTLRPERTPSEPAPGRITARRGPPRWSGGRARRPAPPGRRPLGRPAARSPPGRAPARPPGSGGRRRR